MKKLLFFDTETSGLDSKRHAILQLAWIIEIDGIVVAEQVHDIYPCGDADLNLKALDVNGYTLDRLKAGKLSSVVLQKLYTDVKMAVGGGGSLIPAGHNVKFDIDFLYAMAKGGTDTFWLHFGNSSYINLKKPLCTLAMSHVLDFAGVHSLQDYKLSTLCKYYNIPLIGAHDALQDVRATRLLFHKLYSCLRSGSLENEII